MSLLMVLSNVQGVAEKKLTMTKTAICHKWIWCFFLSGFFAVFVCISGNLTDIMKFC